MTEPVVKIEPRPEKPEYFWMSEKVATLRSETGELVQIDRAINNPFVFLMRGDENEAEIDITEFMKSVAQKVMKNGK
jgi:hypothetical protein